MLAQSSASGDRAAQSSPVNPEQLLNFMPDTHVVTVDSQSTACNVLLCARIRLITYQHDLKPQVGMIRNIREHVQ